MVEDSLTLAFTDNTPKFSHLSHWASWFRGLCWIGICFIESLLVLTAHPNLCDHSKVIRKGMVRTIAENHPSAVNRLLVQSLRQMTPSVGTWIQRYLAFFPSPCHPLNLFALLSPARFSLQLSWTQTTTSCSRHKIQENCSWSWLIPAHMLEAG